MRKIIVAFDSFKGSVHACDTVEFLARSIRKVLPDCEVVAFPIADGGEGTMDVIAFNTPVRRLLCQVHGPLMERMSASYVVTKDGTVVIETAAASGLPLVDVSQRNPMETTTWGTGDLIRDALKRGYRKFIIGLGGSATNDAGIGVMHALGARFLDRQGKILQPIGRNLVNIAHIDTSRLCPELHQSSFVLACDVINSFYGEQGAAVVFAPQKGATSAQVAQLDEGLRSYAQVVLRETGCDLSVVPGAGAAGGMGGGLLPFLKSELKPGIDILLDLMHFDEALQGADLILAGEGKIDRQTAMGKALSGVLRRAQTKQVPVVGLGGCIEDVQDLNRLGFTALFPVHPTLLPMSEAMKEEVTLRHLSQTVLQVLRLWEAR